MPEVSANTLLSGVDVQFNSDTGLTVTQNFGMYA